MMIDEGKLWDAIEATFNNATMLVEMCIRKEENGEKDEKLEGICIGMQQAMHQLAFRLGLRLVEVGRSYDEDLDLEYQAYAVTRRNEA